MAEFPALPLWTDAYLADTRHLNTVEHGAYLLLMMEAWRRPTCSLPDDDNLLARLAGLPLDEWLAIRAVIMSFWKRDGRTRTFVQKRLSAEKRYVVDRSKIQKEKAAKRWNKGEKSDAAAKPNGCPDDAPTPTPTPSIEEERPTVSSNGEPSDRLAAGSESLPEALQTSGSSFPTKSGVAATAIDEVGEAFDRYSAVRCELKPGAMPIRRSPARRTALAARLREVGGLDGWDAVLAKVRGSPFLRGETSRDGKFVAEIDWLLKPANLTKVMEGNYDDRRRDGPAGQPPVRSSPIDALGIAIAASGLG